MNNNNLNNYTNNRCHNITHLTNVITSNLGVKYELTTDPDNHENAFSTFHIVTATEMFDYALQQFIDYTDSIVPDTINVLLINFESNKQFYNTVTIQVSVRMLEPDYLYNKGVMGFADWKLKKK